MKYLILLFFVSSAFAQGVGKEGMNQCPNKPNCVSSLVSQDDDHFVEPIKSYDLILDKVRTYVNDQESWSIVKDEGDYIHAIQKSKLLGFIDDIEFMVKGDLLHIRSASRSGYYDFGVNRKRVEKIRDYLK